MKLTAKQEAFCQAIVSGLSQADAYRKAYDAERMKPATVQKRASELMANGAVTGRVTALRQPIVEELQYGLREAMLEAGEAMEMSREKCNPGAMVAAVTLRSKLFGLLKERVEHTGKDGAPIRATYSLDDDTLLAIAAQARAQGPTP